MPKHVPVSWLWPDHVIGKRESRVLREAHNEAINDRADLLAACKAGQELARTLAAVLNDPGFLVSDLRVRQINAAIRAAEGE